MNPTFSPLRAPTPNMVAMLDDKDRAPTNTHSPSSGDAGGGALAELPPKSSAEKLPPEIWFRIAEEFPVADRSRLSGVDRNLHGLMRDAPDVRLRHGTSALKSSRGEAASERLEELAGELQRMTAQQRSAFIGVLLPCLHARSLEKERECPSLRMQKAFCAVITGLGETLPFVRAPKAVTKSLMRILHADINAVHRGDGPAAYDRPAYESAFRTIKAQAEAISPACAEAVVEGTDFKSELGQRLVPEMTGMPPMLWQS